MEVKKSGNSLGAVRREDVGGIHIDGSSRDREGGLNKREALDQRVGRWP